MVVLGEHGPRAGSPGVRARGRASGAGSSVSVGAFFAAPECGNAPAGGAAEIATRHPPSHNASRRTALFYNTRRDVFNIRQSVVMTFETNRYFLWFVSLMKNMFRLRTLMTVAIAFVYK